MAADRPLQELGFDRHPNGERLLRIGSGERFSRGLVRDAWDVRRAGALVWADALLLSDDTVAALAHPAGFDGAVACATAIYVAPDAAQRLGDAVRALGDPAEVRCGATLVNGIVVARFLSRRPLALRVAFGAFWKSFRHAVAGLPPVLPRLWHV